MDQLDNVICYSILLSLIQNLVCFKINYALFPFFLHTIHQQG